VTQPLVRVGIVSWNTGALLDRCLAALPAALDGCPAEIVVVDNASSDDSVAIARRHGVEVVVNAENRGYARGMNQALAGSTAPVLLALNPDTDPAPRSLATLVERVRADASIGVIAPRLVNEDGSLQHSVYRFPSLRVAAVVCFVPQRLFAGPIGRRFWLEGFAPHDRSGEVDWAIGAVHCMRATAVAREAIYDERSFMYAEDLELCWRLHQEGWRVVFAPDVIVRHRANAAGEQAWGNQRTARWLDATYRWYADARGPRQARAWAAVNTAGVAVKLAGNMALLRVFPFGRQKRADLVGLFKTFVRLHAKKLRGGPYVSLTDPS
jgi:GT2 family glycosyltransferase